MAGTDWRVVLLVVVLSSCVVASLVTVDVATHVKAPSSGHVDTTTPVGWMAVIGAVVVFGSFGILIKAPEVQEAQVHPVAFQLYFSLGCDHSRISRCTHHTASPQDFHGLCTCVGIYAVRLELVTRLRHLGTGLTDILIMRLCGVGGVL